MQSTGVCHSYKSTKDLTDLLVDKWNEKLLMWQDMSKHDSEIEHELIQHTEYIKGFTSFSKQCWGDCY